MLAAVLSQFAIVSRAIRSQSLRSFRLLRCQWSSPTHVSILEGRIVLPRDQHPPGMRVSRVVSSRPRGLQPWWPHSGQSRIRMTCVEECFQVFHLSFPQACAVLYKPLLTTLRA